MSKYTVQIDQFLLNKLQPEIDKLNLSLLSMQERGYENKALTLTKNKLNHLVIVYDFLKEYAYGDEEADLTLLNDIMSIVGAYKISNKTHSKIVQSTRDSLDINEIGGCLDFIRYYLNNEIIKSDILAPAEGFNELKVYASDSVDHIEVTITVTGENPKTYIGKNYVTIPNLELDYIEVIALEIITKDRCGDTKTVFKEFNIQEIPCSEGTYWVGTTPERFTINLDLNESSDITINPNEGSNITGVELDYEWFENNRDIMEEYMYREELTQTVTTIIDDSHAFILVPTSLLITDIMEVVNGTPVDATQGLHYDIFELTSPVLNKYNCIYFRDLTSLTFQERVFQFTIKQI